MKKVISFFLSVLLFAGMAACGDGGTNGGASSEDAASATPSPTTVPTPEPTPSPTPEPTPSPTPKPAVYETDPVTQDLMTRFKSIQAEYDLSYDFTDEIERAEEDDLVNYVVFSDGTCYQNIIYDDEGRPVEFVFFVIGDDEILPQFEIPILPYFSDSSTRDLITAALMVAQPEWTLGEARETMMALVTDEEELTTFRGPDYTLIVERVGLLGGVDRKAEYAIHFMTNAAIEAQTELPPLLADAEIDKDQFYTLSREV